MSERCRITFQIEQEGKDKIEAIIKKEYPKLKTVSDVMRAALKQFLSKEDPAPTSPEVKPRK